MGISSYSELQTAVANYMHRSNLTDKIPDFIALAEAEMKRLLRVWRQETTSTLSITAGTAEVALPSNTKRIIAAKLTGTNERELRRMPLAALTHKYKDAESGIPIDYALSEDNMILGPVPSEDGSISALVMTETPALSDIDTTNVILQNYPDLYLYGAAKHGFAHIRHAERIAEANELFMSGIDEANQESIKRQMSGTPRPPYRMSNRSIV